MGSVSQAELVARLDALEHQLAIQQDIEAIRNLQYAYGYFIDKTMYDETVDLFAEDGEVWFLGGVFKGRRGLDRLYKQRFRVRRNGPTAENGPRYGRLADHLQLQAIIHVNPNRKSAQVRCRTLMQAGLHETADGELPPWWEGGIYENEFVREGDVWKIRALRYYPFWHANFHDGWGRTPIDFVPNLTTLYPEDPLGPDALIEPAPRLWPATDTVPYHFNHPVTGEPIALDNSRAREGFAGA